MKTIKRFAPHRTALTFACVMAISSLIFIIPMSLVFLVSPATDANGNSIDTAMPLGMMVAMPFLYLIMGYLMTIVGAWIYNGVSGFTGGIQFEMMEDDER